MSSKNRTVVLLLLVTAASNPGASLGDDDRVVQLVRGAGRSEAKMRHHHKDDVKRETLRRRASGLGGLGSGHASHSVSCPELNNVTFTNEPPFDVLGVPECGDGVKPKMELFLPKKEIACDLNPFYLPNDETRLCLEALKRQTEVTKLVLVTHGFLKDFDTPWLHQFQRDIQEVEENTAVLVIGWGHGIWDILSYWRTAANTRYLGQAMYQVIKYVHEVVDDRKLVVHCIAHSLGAHACGFAGKHLLVDPDRELARALDRISGMDPAGPLFCNDVPFPFDHMVVMPAARLGPHDAKFVDVIHTDGDARYLGILPQYGTMERLGTVDFYPGRRGAYGHNQPGCLDFINIVSCSHSRARKLYQTSIKTEICLAAKRCHGDPKMIPNSCGSLDSGEVVAMGYWWDAMEPTEDGTFIVEVGSRSPYCQKDST